MKKNLTLNFLFLLITLFFTQAHSFTSSLDMKEKEKLKENLVKVKNKNLELYEQMVAAVDNGLVEKEPLIIIEDTNPKGLKGSIHVFIPLGESLNSPMGFLKNPSGNDGWEERPNARNSESRPIGFALDLDFNQEFVGKGHNLAIDYYTGSVARRFPLPSDVTAKQKNKTRGAQNLTALFVGYRYRFPIGAYIGGGLSYLEVERSSDHNKLLNGRYRSGPIPTLTLGYSHVFAPKGYESGFSMGVHLISTQPQDVSSSNGKILKDARIKSIGLLLGYGW